MAKILVVDDEPSVADMVARALRADHSVTTCTYAPATLELAKEIKPDLVILDVMMPEMDGFEVCRMLRSDPVLADVPVIFLTAKDQVEHKLEGFEVGADDYIPKPFDLREISMRIQAVLRRSQPLALGELEVGPLKLNTNTYEVRVEDKSLVLTPVEFELLSHLMRHPGEVFNTERLLQEVWGYPPGLGSPDLVRVHVRNLRLKLEPDPRHPKYIQTVGRYGYTVRPNSETAEGQA